MRSSLSSAFSTWNLTFERVAAGADVSAVVELDSFTLLTAVDEVVDDFKLLDILFCCCCCCWFLVNYLKFFVLIFFTVSEELHK